MSYEPNTWRIIDYLVTLRIMDAPHMTSELDHLAQALLCIGHAGMPIMTEPITWWMSEIKKHRVYDGHAHS